MRRLVIFVGVCFASVVMGCQMPPSTIQNDFLGVMACLDEPAETQAACLDGFVAAYALAHDVDTRALLAELEAARLVDRTLNGWCHPVAHAIGRWTFQDLGQVGDSFNACDQSCHSGCFHGVMERVFVAQGQDGHVSVDELRAAVPAICTDANFEDPSFAEIFQCLHGLGHAILYTVDYALPLGLQVCDTLSESAEQQMCATGVIMENITAFDKDKRDIDPSRPLYPCDSIASKYQATCYRMQTSLMLEYRLTLAEIEAQCGLAALYASDCFVSLGRDYSAYFLIGDIADAVAACQEYSTGYEDACLAGMEMALIDNSWDARFAYPYCNLLRPDNTALCYHEANIYLSWMYQYSGADIRNQCATYAYDGESVCLDNLPPAARAP